MFFNMALYISLIIFGVGMIYKICGWFWKNVGVGQTGIQAPRRLVSASKSFVSMLFSPKILTLLNTFLIDVLLQRRILKDREDRTVWFMHLCIFAGFIFLLLFHTLDGIITIRLFPEYQPTLNPFIFLRNFFGFLLIVGLVLAILRRTIFQKANVKKGLMGFNVIILMLLVVGSGFLLEATKISSYSIYQTMVEDYAGFEEQSELEALEAFWVSNFGVISTKARGPFSEDVLVEGRSVHEDNCAACHSRPQWAFVSYSLSRAASPWALGIDKSEIHTLLWYIHFLICFFGLVCFPFSRLFHIFATPISVMVAQLTKPGTENPANIATRQAIEVDGCKHGGACHMRCPVRQMRQQRMEWTTQFSPALEYVDEINWKDLGNRQFE